MSARPSEETVKRKRRIFALDYGRGTMAGYYFDLGASNMNPSPIMNNFGEPSGFAEMDDGEIRVGMRMDTIGGRLYPHVKAFRVNIKEKPNGHDELQIKYAKAWRAQIVKDNKALFEDDVEEWWIIGCPTGWRDKETIANYKRIFVEAGFPNVIIVPESNAAMMTAQKEKAFMNDVNADIGVLCIDLGAYSADATWVKTGQVKSYGGYVGASLIEKMVLRMNFEEACRCEERAYNSEKTLDAVKARCRADVNFRCYVLNKVRQIKEDYFTMVSKGGDFMCMDCLGRVELAVDEASRAVFGSTGFGLYMNDGLVDEIVRKRSVKDVLGGEFDTLPPEVRQDLGNLSWREALRGFVERALKICPEYAARACGKAAGPRVHMILTGGASLMPFVRELMAEMMPNAQIFADEIPMSTIARGLVYFGPEKIRAQAFDDEFMWLVTHDKEGKATSVRDGVINEIISRAHDELGLPLISETLEKIHSALHAEIDRWLACNIDSGQITPEARTRFKAWFEGEGMRNAYAEYAAACKAYITREINDVFRALLMKYHQSPELFVADELELPYIDNFFNAWKGHLGDFVAQLETEGEKYAAWPNPTVLGKTRRQAHINEVADGVNAHCREWRRSAFLALKAKFDSNAVYVPFRDQCLRELIKALEDKKRVILGKMILEDSFA